MATGATGILAETGAAAAPGLVHLTFTPYHALLGGLILGLATAGKLLTTGRVLGISGAVRGLVAGDFTPWRLAFLAGLAAGGVALSGLMPGAFETVSASCPLWRAALSGLLVGVGTSMGNGCTSGHGICGTARLSPRSLANVATFMASGAAAATLSQSARCAGIAPVAPPLVLPTTPELQLAGAMLGGTAAAFVLLAVAARVFAVRGGAGAGGVKSGLAAATGPELAAAAAGAAAGGEGKAAAAGGAGAVAAAAGRPGWELAAEFVTGVCFALGLGFSGMAHATKVVGFLSPLHPAWDPSLIFVMGGAVAVAMVAYQSVLRLRKPAKPLFLPTFSLPASNAIDGRLLAGGALFGAGWGLSGLCPGPALLNGVAHADPAVQAYLACMLVGMALESRLLSRARGGGAKGGK